MSKIAIGSSNDPKYIFGKLNPNHQGSTKASEKTVKSDAAYASSDFTYASDGDLGNLYLQEATERGFNSVEEYEEAKEDAERSFIEYEGRIKLKEYLVTEAFPGSEDYYDAFEQTPDGSELVSNTMLEGNSSFEVWDTSADEYGVTQLNIDEEQFDKFIHSNELDLLKSEFSKYIEQNSNS